MTHLQNLIYKILKNITLATLLSVSSLSAHNFWINSFESFTHKPGHITVGLGWGHSMPIDDILNSPNGKVIVEEFSIRSPKGEITKLNIPTNKIKDPIKKANAFDVYSADIALQKIALKKDSPKGVYEIQAKSKPTFYTHYIDKKDRQRLKLKPKDKIKDIKKVIFSVRYQALAKSYLTLEKWEKPKASNKGLEIIPKTDLSNLKVGDLVEFEVLFMGKPIIYNPPSNMDYILATSPSFDKGKDFSLVSFIKNGKAQFLVKSSGQWIVNCYYKAKVTKDGVLKNEYGKIDYDIQAASLTFNVK